LVVDLNDDNNFWMIVCNPARDSLFTGLRPDTMGTYGFQSTYRPHLLLPTQLARSGYKTAGYGKIRHYEGKDHEVWNYDQFDGKWYDYQYTGIKRIICV